MSTTQERNTGVSIVGLRGGIEAASRKLEGWLNVGEGRDSISELKFRRKYVSERGTRATAWLGW